VRDEVFQVSELVEPYRVAPSIDLEENSNFRVLDDSLVDVDAEELNVVLSSSGQKNVDKDDDIHIEDYVKVMTIQLTTKKKKIRTNYQNETLCKTFFHVIYILCIV
jgi:transposase